MADVEARAEVSRPLLLPMIIPPVPWRYVPKYALFPPHCRPFRMVE